MKMIRSERSSASESREAYGVRAACCRFLSTWSERTSRADRKRQQAARTPYASRGSNAHPRSRVSFFPFLLSAFCFLLCRVHAFPPAPNHTIYGQVRDQYGVPLTIGNAQVIFEPTNGVQITSTIVPGLEPGINYLLTLPMDSGTAADLY
jgi:hypothetical protein